MKVFHVIGGSLGTSPVFPGGCGYPVAPEAAGPVTCEASPVNILAWKHVSSSPAASELG